MFGKRDAQQQAEFNLKMAAGGLGIRYTAGEFRMLGQGSVPLAGAEIRLEDAEASRRLTATRVALIGPFALLAKKTTAKMFLTILGADGSGIIVDIPKAKELKARQLQQLVTAAQ